jgi:hypothetical protein
MKGQLGKSQDIRQSAVENPLSTLGTMLALLEHDRLRICQAVGRHAGLLELLAPVIGDIDRMSAAIREIQCGMKEDWESGQKKRWR